MSTIEVEGKSPAHTALMALEIEKATLQGQNAALTVLLRLRTEFELEGFLLRSFRLLPPVGHSFAATAFCATLEQALRGRL